MDFALPQLLTILCCINVYASRVERPRGVSLTKKVFYDPDKDFTCLDGSQTIAFSHVNDDYCDCTDGSDEPGTSACPKSSFHCTNAGFRPLNIPSSRVNDGICDCCDGSDEWNIKGFCPDTCKELWRATREDLQRQAEAANRGIAVRKEYSDRGIAIKTENQKKLVSLKNEVEEIKWMDEELLARKKQAEHDEKEAKDTEQLAWNDFKMKVEQRLESRQAADAFTELDANKDGSVSVDELQLHPEIDSNTDDEAFTEDEAKAILEGDSAEAPHFIENTWKKISGNFISIPIESHDSEAVQHPDQGEEDHLDDDLNEDDDDAFGDENDDALDDDEDNDPDEDYHDDDDKEENDLDQDADLGDLRHSKQLKEPETTQPSKSEAATSAKASKANLPVEPVWSDAVKVLIAASDKVREEYENNKRKMSDIEREISSLEKKLEIDFGPDESYQELHGHCYELHTHEYIYKLCPFDKAVQKPKSGGSETSLGRWDSWNGPPNNKYSSMRYLSGLRCWNGPDRSTEVKISCGDENKLSSASEPSRCEYRFEFATPAACEPLDIPDQPHDEL